MRRTLKASVLLIGSLLAQAVLTETPLYTMEQTETGLREYYCQATFTMKSDCPSRFADINGFFYVYIGDDEVGRSKGASFQFSKDETEATALFETPNAPCDDIDGYEFVVGACMEGRSFADRNECAATIATGGLIKATRGR